jgi:hypothetical protein
MNMNKVKVTHHSDAGHSWYAVKRVLIEKAGVSTAISSYSYQRGDTVYLEEDADAPKFFEAIDRSKLEVKQAKFQSRSPIRSYPSYTV